MMQKSPYVALRITLPYCPFLNFPPAKQYISIYSTDVWKEKEIDEE